MSLLVRKIDKAKWLQNDIVRGEDISADAITNCMKTYRNTLSAWQIDNDAEIDDAVLAIVSSHQHLDTIDIVCISKDRLDQNGINMKSTPGRTPVEDLTNKHIDIANLTYKTLGDVAYHIVKAFCEQNVKRYTRGSLKKLLKEAINSGRLDIANLEPSVSIKLK